MAAAGFLKGRVPTAPSETVANRAGELPGRAGTGDAVDAIVAATAVEMDAAAAFTSDPDDLEALLDVSDAVSQPLIHKV